MPKTYTDDIQPAFPSSIQGPLLIVDPADSASWIKIDPSAAAISAAGTASPVRSTVAPFVRTYSAASGSLIGQAAPSHFVTATATGGFYTAPFIIPFDMDVAQVSRVKLLLAPLNDDTGSGEVARLQLGVTHVATAQTPVDTTVTYDWTVPTDWLVSSPRIVTIDAGSGNTFAGSTFSAGMWVAFRVARIGGATEDTFDKSLNIGNAVVFEYTANRY